MDDSDQDFIDLCSKPLKRVRKKPAEGRNRPKAEQKSVSQASSREKRKANPKEDVGSGGSKCARTQTDHSDSGAAQEVVCLGAGGDAGGAQRAEKLVRAKDKVLQKMQQFKRAGPQKMALTGRTAAATKEENDCVALSAAADKQGGTAGELAPVNEVFFSSSIPSYPHFLFFQRPSAQASMRGPRTVTRLWPCGCSRTWTGKRHKPRWWTWRMEASSSVTYVAET